MGKEQSIPQYDVEATNGREDRQCVPNRRCTLPDVLDER
jgi:hypothetical protein